MDALKKTLRQRSSGLLLHLSSLPGPNGIGDLGPEAFRFADFLNQSGQTWWQMLPVGPCGPGYSPYNPPSSFAGNPLFLSIELLRQEGWLKAEDLPPKNTFSAGRIRYLQVATVKRRCLRKAFSAFESRSSLQEDFRNFCEEKKGWLADYALFCALQDRYRGSSWRRWEEDIRRREPSALSRARKNLARIIRYHQFLQFCFFRQWEALKNHCRRKNLALLGDLPLFATYESAEVWSHPELFQLNSQGHPTAVAGVPPDYFSKNGQLWGNPLYRWEILRETGYRWWLERLREALLKFDALRLDHFIGFQRYWEVPADAKTARDGQWKPGPGEDFFHTLFQTLGPLELIAEDLGEAGPDIYALRDRFGLPGMAVLQFSFGEHIQSREDLYRNIPSHCVLYTGTHDNDTMLGWLREGPSPKSLRSQEKIQIEKTSLLKCLGSGESGETHWDILRLAASSPANTVLFPVQDLLGLGTQARMNLPGTSRGNWRWRLSPSALDSETAEKLRELTRQTSREPPA